VLAFRIDWTMLVNLAGVKLEKGKFDEAEDLYLRAKTKAPENVKDYLDFNIALVSYNKGDYKKVIELLSNKEWINPQPYLMLSDALNKLGKDKEASEVLKKIQK
jgi:tetratricopeptide (TPR) repeat protein